MKIQDVRIGNLVSIPDPQDGGRTEKRIVSIHQYPHFDQKDRICTWYSQEQNFIYTDIENVLGLELNEKRLAQFGFERIPREGYSIALPDHNKRLYVAFDRDNEVRIMSPIEILTIAKNIIHVHQLQNIFFALSGEELKP